MSRVTVALTQRAFQYLRTKHAEYLPMSVAAPAPSEKVASGGGPAVLDAAG